MKRDNISGNSTTVGILYAFAAFILWGFLPIYWKLLDGIPAGEILAHRIFWSAVFLASIIIVSGRLKDIKRAVSNTRNMVFITACAILITINWGVYIVSAPTIQIIIGVLMYGEQFTDIHLISFGFIWLGLIIYSLAQVGILGKAQTKIPYFGKE
ncbi:MAG: putative inner membrane protein RarD [Firmicutes bacterium]|nr:putative inner membrane protein RarD [Bacillota bacterium]